MRSATGSVTGHLDQEKRARVHHHAGLGAIGLDADRPREHGIVTEALAQNGDVVEAVQQRQHQPGLRHDALQRRLQPGGLRGDDQHVHRLLQASNRARMGDELAEADAVNAQPAGEIASAVASRATTTTGVPARSSSPAISPPTPPGPSTAIFTARV